ncbi:MAG: MBL fold metallo-hydrolase [Campylobacterota bacterium]|nr:MBL fold metallo-hydrolase [Campylobacterota bacterium]
MAFIRSFGAVGVVTGSTHLLTLDNGKKILIDCGMFQGENESKNIKSLEFDPSEVDWLIFTHAHLDHVGRAPILYKEGFRGKIVATRPTIELSRVVLLDSAHLAKEEYYTYYKKAQRKGEEDLIKPPLYTAQDVESFLTLKKIYAIYSTPIVLQKDLIVTFYNAGHILGSSFVEICFKENGVDKVVVFSGDLGNKNDIVLPFPQNGKKADALYIESTYGDRNHKNMKKSIKEFKKAILKTLKNGGIVLIPSFAIERTQELLSIFKLMYKSGELPSSCKIFLDSPMAIRATNIYNKYANELSELCQNFLEEDGSVFDFPQLEFTQTQKESMKINKIQDNAIIIAGSGMCNGGRILQHFKHRLWNKKNAVLFVGYQAKGTLGRRIVDGTKWVKFYNEQIKIKANIHTINGFSAHADQSELIKWIKHFDRLGKIFLIHGEKDKQIIFKKAIKNKLGKKAHIIEKEDEIYV